MIAIVDYGGGNLRSVENAFRHIGVPCKVTDDARDIAKAERVVLPGVGHFGQLMASIGAKGLRECLVTAATDGRPFLGICLGMHALFESSEEDRGDLRGLGVIEGTVKRLPAKSAVPHMGWNEVVSTVPAVPGGWYSFAHSYFIPIVTCTVGTCTYQSSFSAAVLVGNALGVQFHPEKSGAIGLALLEAFCGFQP